MNEFNQAVEVGKCVLCGGICKPYFTVCDSCIWTEAAKQKAASNPMTTPLPETSRRIEEIKKHADILDEIRRTERLSSGADSDCADLVQFLYELSDISQSSQVLASPADFEECINLLKRSADEMIELEKKNSDLERRITELAQSQGEGKGDSRDSGDEHRATKIMVQFAANFSQLAGTPISAEGDLFGGLKKEILGWVSSIRKMNRLGEEARKTYFAKVEKQLRDQIATLQANEGSLESQLSALKAELEYVKSDKSNLKDTIDFMTGQLQASRKFHTEAQQEADSLRSELEQARAERDSVRQQLVESDAKLLALEEEKRDNRPGRFYGR